MKRFFALLTAGIISLACAACGCTNSEPATIPSTVTTIPTTMPPVTLPSMETNIPDPEVNDNSTMETDIPNTVEETTRPSNGMNRSGRHRTK